MARPRRFTQAALIEALGASRGLVVLAARRLGCDRDTVYRYAGRYPKVAAALEEAREAQLDVTEGKLFKRIDEGELGAITFYLRTVGRGRGYGDKIDVAARVDAKIAGEEAWAKIQVTLMDALGPFPEARAAAAAALLALDAPAEKGRRRAGTAHPNGRAHPNGL